MIFDGSPLVSVNGIMKRMMLQFYLNITHKSQQRDKKTLAQATKSICPQEYLRDFLQVLDNMSDTTIINYISEIANFRLKDDVDTPNTKIYFYYGTAVNELLAKKSAQVIAKNYSGSVIKCFKGKGHCENALSVHCVTSMSSTGLGVVGLGLRRDLVGADVSLSSMYSRTGAGTYFS